MTRNPKASPEDGFFCKKGPSVIPTLVNHNRVMLDLFNLGLCAIWDSRPRTLSAGRRRAAVPYQSSTIPEQAVAKVWVRSVRMLVT